ncbi:hypothetical protein L6452_04790 [Arctium lappa]|uniref:Uncharacterized protein n=1 Tax=Arctium lappa TaxID=4217 RepID=A0ACB9EFN1_ARCLA|nr:hypothetical protein L6452_04790 [Arctium lappa]
MFAFTAIDFALPSYLFVHVFIFVLYCIYIHIHDILYIHSMYILACVMYVFQKVGNCPVCIDETLCVNYVVWIKGLKT